MITPKEKKILNYLTKAWNLFIQIRKQHPDETKDFGDGIHKCQYIIGMRIARRAEPEIFPEK